jgi:hypothetical protein
MTTRETVWLQLGEALPAVPDGWWRVEPAHTQPAQWVVQAVARLVRLEERASWDHVVVARFFKPGGRPSPEHVVTGTGPDEVAALQDLLARVQARYPKGRY